MRLRKIIFPLVFFVFFVPQGVRAESSFARMWNSQHEEIKEAFLLFYIKGRVQEANNVEIVVDIIAEKHKLRGLKNKDLTDELTILSQFYKNNASKLARVDLTRLRLTVDRICATEEYNFIYSSDALNIATAYAMGLIDEKAFKKALEELAKESKK